METTFLFNPDFDKLKIDLVEVGELAFFCTGNYTYKKTPKQKFWLLWINPRFRHKINYL